MDNVNFNPTQTNQMCTKDKIFNFCWYFINSTFFRLTPTHFAIFRKLRVAMLKLFGAKLEWSVSIHPTVKIEYPWNLTMMEKSSLGEGCWVYALTSICVGKKSCIGNDVYLLTGSHDIEKETFDLITKPINVGDNVWISTRAIILPNVTIGNWSVIAAGATVVKDVEEQSVVGGNPANFIKKRIIKE